MSLPWLVTHSLHFCVLNRLIKCDLVGWEYSTDGNCTKMPSTKLLNVKIKSIPCLEQDGMIWVWPGDEPPSPTLPSLKPPSGFVIHAEVTPTFQEVSPMISSAFSYVFF